MTSSHTVLITGGSGYLGGTVLARLKSASVPLPHSPTIYASARSQAQSSSLAAYGVKPLVVDFTDHVAVAAKIRDLNITVVFFLIDAFNSELQVEIIKALADVGRRKGVRTHFLHTSGAKLFSAWADFPIDRKIGDADEGVYALQKRVKPGIPPVGKAVNTNNTVIDTAEQLGVRSYVFVPCIVYGRGEGFGNKTSIQTVAIVKAAKATGRVYDVNKGRPTWPVSSVGDTANLYIQLLRSILAGENPSHGTHGYYLAASGSVAWADLYSAMATAMKKRGVIADAEVRAADDEALEKMGNALNVPADLVGLQLGGHCTFVAKRGAQIGWKVKDSTEHIFESAESEVMMILESLEAAPGL